MSTRMVIPPVAFGHPGIFACKIRAVAAHLPVQQVTAGNSQGNEKVAVNPDGEGFSATSCLTQPLGAKGLNGPEGIGTKVKKNAFSTGKTKVLEKDKTPNNTESNTLRELFSLWDALSEEQKKAIFRIARG